MVPVPVTTGADPFSDGASMIYKIDEEFSMCSIDKIKGQNILCGEKSTAHVIKKSTAPGIPRRSPIQVLTGLDVA